LFHFCIYKKLYPLAGAEVDFRFYLMLVSNTFIAAAGYMINDYFDVNIDQVNKPEKVVVGSYISRRWVIFWHLILSVFAIYISSTVFPFKTYWHIHLSNLLAILLLWFYSTTFKKNFLISSLILYNLVSSHLFKVSFQVWNRIYSGFSNSFEFTS
jgi:4-hydroxybenzoate polyprenyltransferase